MEICSQHHDEIVWDGGPCPMCEEGTRITGLENEVETLKDEIAYLEKAGA